MTQPEMCVIFNPSAGRGRAPQRLASFRAVLGERAAYRPSTGPGHAEELAYQAAQEGFQALAAAGGDGTVHEVANGLLRAARPEVALVVVPIGSANDYAYSLGLQAAWWQLDAPWEERLVDVGRAQSPCGRDRYFINGLGLGFNGAVTLESRRIRRLQGVALYFVALLRALAYHYVYPPMSISFDGQCRQARTLALSVALGRREGNFLIAPHALLDDGLFDYVQAGPIPRWELLRYVPAMIAGTLPTDHPALWMGRCRQVEVRSEAALTVHLDGEFFSQPGDDVRAVNMRLLPGALRVQGRWRKDQPTALGSKKA